MALYFTLPFGVYALALLHQRHSGNFFKIGLGISWLLVIFTLTFGVIWSPFVIRGGISTIEDIVYRIFPVRRGIFEGKVATVWCMLHHSGFKFLKVNFWERSL